MGLLWLSLNDQAAQQRWLMGTSVSLLCWLSSLATELRCNKNKSSSTISFTLEAKGLVRAPVLEESLWMDVFREGPGWDLSTEMSWQ